ncbi:MAG: PolC-type DNA polymerase III [Hydrogenibacillus sp.]|nr:PolC-type DNA polymerase III [Hydrogenibacillus sp.]
MNGERPSASPKIRSPVDRSDAGAARSRPGDSAADDRRPDAGLSRLIRRVPPDEALRAALEGARLERLIVEPDARRWIVRLAAPRLLPVEPLLAWEAALQAALPEPAEVELDIRIDPPPSFPDAADAFRGVLLSYLKARRPALARALVDIVLDGPGRIGGDETLEANGERREGSCERPAAVAVKLIVDPVFAPALSDDALAEDASRVLSRYTGIKPRVIVETLAEDAAEAAFETRREVLRELAQSALESAASRIASVETKRAPEAQALEAAPAPGAMNGGGTGGGRAPADVGAAVDRSGVRVVLGRPIREEPKPLAFITEADGRAVAEGRIFALERRALRGGTTLLTLKITDGESALAVKAFLRSAEDVQAAETLDVGDTIRMRGTVAYDAYERDLVLTASDVSLVPASGRADRAPKKRVELHLHTAMSAMDAPLPVEDAVRQAKAFGHGAVAITDHGVVQAFPEAYEAGKKYGVKIIYGMEAYLVDDETVIVLGGDRARRLADDVYVVFDVETTGLSPEYDTIIELGAVKIEGGAVTARFQSFAAPLRPLPPKITELTGITEAMLKDAPPLAEVLADFRAFAEGATLVAHNARFDLGFLRSGLARVGLPPLEGPAIDTLGLSRYLLPDLKNHRLDTLAQYYGVALEQHHRAADDAAATGEILLRMIAELVRRGIDTQGALMDVRDAQAYAKGRPKHVTIWVESETGLRNLYRLVTRSHLETFHRVPRVTRRDLTAHREGLIVGSACDEGELFDAALNESLEALVERTAFYDVVEVMPIDAYRPRVDADDAEADPIIREAIEKLVAAAEIAGKPVIATGNVHHLEPKDVIFRRILLANQNGVRTKDPERIRPLFFRTTEEMLAEFAFLGADKAQAIVVDNPNAIAERIPDLKPFPDDLYTPVIEGAEAEIRRIATERARERYGDPLPSVVAERLERELRSIIDGGYAVIYLIAQKLVQKSLEDGYLVGSRGSVGSSLAATMLGITEVNPLPPHYVCPNCRYSAFIEDGSIKSGFDLPEKSCPQCGTPLHRDGHDIPFETFMGFKGDKVPDIDLNFSGEYQPQAHKYTEALLGASSVFRAGTISTVAEKTAYGFVRKYLEERGETRRKAEIDWLAQGTAGVKRTTGQHPGGLIVVPRHMDVHAFTPLQRPADDPRAETITTHFDYHALSGRLLKLDILGHDDPTVLRMLQDLSGIDPRTLPPTDPQVMALFRGTEVLGENLGLEAIDVRTGTLGIPEFGTRFVRGMLEETRPTTFAELVQISGLSHGTDVWLGNAQELIRSGTAELKDVIGCRDDIMVTLIYRGLEPSQAFRIMESVRKGKGVPPADQEAMRQKGVPEWYIESCQKIKYMFPKAHAVAYVMMAVRIAYFKVYHPLLFYATYFSVRADDFDLSLVQAGEEAVKAKIVEILGKGAEATAKEKNVLTVLEVVYEMLRRGFRFHPLDLYRSHATRFIPHEDGLIPPFTALAGLGESAAVSIDRARADGPFLSVEDFHSRTRLSKTLVEELRALGVFGDLPETNQMTLF